MKIGVIHTAFIGDIVLTGLLVEGLYQAGHEIVFFTKSKTSAIFQNDIRVTKVVELKKPSGIQKLFAFKSMVAQIRNEELSVLICPHRSLTTTLCAYFSRVKLTVGFQNAAFSFLYRIRKPYNTDLHECARLFSLLPKELCPDDISARVAGIGRPILRYEGGSLDPAVKPRDDTAKPRDDTAKPRDDTAKPQDNYFIVAIGSMWNTKKYVREYLLEICANILNSYPHLTCYLTGDKNDEADCEDFASSLNQDAVRVINTAGKSNLMDFARLVMNAKLILANDSSPVHFSSAFNIPVICFWGPTSVEYGFGPLAERRLVISHKTIFGHNLSCQPCDAHGAKMCPQKHHLCMKKLTPKFVLPRIRNFLNSLTL